MSEKLKILKNTVARFNNPKTSYSWMHSGMCNVGQLMQEITGLNHMEIVFIATSSPGQAWKGRIDYPQHSVELEKLLSKAKAKGFTEEELGQLELLRDPAVLSHVDTMSPDWGLRCEVFSHCLLQRLDQDARTQRIQDQRRRRTRSRRKAAVMVPTTRSCVQHGNLWTHLIHDS